MDVRIGIQNVAREVVIDSNEAPEDVAKTVSDALSAGGLLTLTDAKGRQVIIPTSTIGFVEVGSETARPVGFAQ
ncbi:DUF3107 domain-containing protein [Zhihengliuella somnathii]